jgi:hypothetical protein
MNELLACGYFVSVHTVMRAKESAFITPIEVTRCTATTFTTTDEKHVV